MNCPILTWNSDPVLSGQTEMEVLLSAQVAIAVDVVVMTQACDLENDKVSNVVLCPHYSLADYKVDWAEGIKALDQNPTEKAWKTFCTDLKDGYLWNLAMLNQGVVDALHTSVRIVDFHDIYTVPRSFLERLLVQREQPRLRLLPPYREHLSQAFARYFMRVGLPVPVLPSW